MVGPSSSHTAGAARIGFLAGKIYEELPKSVQINLYNSFAQTGKGHGTDKSILAGILGLGVDDENIKNSFQTAKQKNLKVSFDYLQAPERHPNSCDIIFFDGKKRMKITADSLGAGEIRITSIDGFEANLQGDYFTLFLVYKDKPGMISKVTSIIQENGINIANLSCSRTNKGETASMTISLDTPLDNNIVGKKLAKIQDIYTVRNIDKLRK